MLPNQPMILLSFVNTKLRDDFDSLDAFCEDYEADREVLEEKLRTAGFLYDEAQNQFR